MTTFAWSPARMFTRQIAESLNLFAASERILLTEEFAQGAAGYVLHLERPLDRYSMVCRYSCSYGELTIGLDLGDLFPEYSADVVSRVAKDKEGVAGWIDWLVSPWLERIERHLGLTMSLQSAEVNGPFSHDAIAFLVTREDGGTGHLAIAGSALGHVRWNEIALCEPRQKRMPDGLRVTVAVLYESRELPLADLRKISIGAVLHVPWSGARLHIGSLASGFRYHIRWKNEEVFMEDSKLASERSAFATIDHDPDGEPVPLENVVFNIDVVLDRRLMTLSELEGLHAGGIFAVERPISGKAVSLCCNGRLIARGEIVGVDGQLAILINECNSQPV